MENKKVNKYINDLNKKKTWANKNLNLDNHYVFTKKYYKHMKRVFAEGNPTFIIQYGIILPFDLPFEGKEFALNYLLGENHCQINYNCQSIKQNKDLFFGFIKQKAKKYDSYYTRCEISILLENPYIHFNEIDCNLKEDMISVKNKNGKTEMEDFFNCTSRVFKTFDFLRNLSIDKLNEVIIKYAFVVDDDSVRTVTKDNIEYASHFRGIDIETWETFNWMTLHSIYGIPKEKKELSNEKFATALEMANMNHQFDSYFAHFQNARFLLSQGNAIQSIVEFNTASEELVSTIILMNWVNETNMTEEEISEKFENTPFKKRINSELPKILGGQWNIKDEKTVVGAWFIKTYDLRNRIVHGGYTPDDHEIFEAVSCEYDFINYVIELMNKSKYEYFKGINSVPHVKIATMKM